MGFRLIPKSMKFERIKKKKKKSDQAPLIEWLRDQVVDQLIIMKLFQITCNEHIHKIMK